MSGLPSPRNIRRGWCRIKDPANAVAQVLERYAFFNLKGDVIEARAWRIARGNRSGWLKRVDILFSTGSSASARFGERAVTLHLGAEVCR